MVSKHHHVPMMDRMKRNERNQINSIFCNQNNKYEQIQRSSLHSKISKDEEDETMKKIVQMTENERHYNDDTTNTIQSIMNNNTYKSRSTTIERRKALMCIAAAITATTTAANAFDGAKEETKDTLEDISIGKGQWMNQNEYQKMSDPSVLSISSTAEYTKVLPTVFITYMTRFLINYDATIHEWWYDDILYKYSLLAVAGGGDSDNGHDEYNQQLQSNFSSLAKTVQLACIDFLNSVNIDDEAMIKARFESLFQLFVTSYGQEKLTSNVEGDFSDNRDERMNQIMLLFSMLPSKVQPVNGLKSAQSSITKSISFSNNIMNNNKNNYNQLLVTSMYKSIYDSTSQSFTINPPIMNNFEGTKQELVFGSISSKPLQRQQPDLSFNIYSLFGLCGATGCALTHTVVIPFDVVKTKLQTNPDQYDNLIDGVISISNEEDGLNTFLLGSQATIVGYFWYGLSVYPTYSFTKWFLEHNIFDAASAVVNMNLISLIAGAAAAVVASVGLTPIEAARIRTVAEPSIYRELGLLGTLQTIASEDINLGWKSLYAGFPSLVTRQVIFG